MSDTNDAKIMGFIPRARYLNIMYMLMLAATLGGIVMSVLEMFGIEFYSLGPLLGLAGILGLALGLFGIFKFELEFSTLVRNHFIYASAVYAVLWFVAVLFGNALGFVVILGYLVFILLGIAQAILLWTGYNSWKSGRFITKDTLKDEVKAALANR